MLEAHLVIELPDQTRVPGGRKRAGEFTVTLQMARNEDRQAYITWFNRCVDRNTRHHRGDLLNVDVGNLRGEQGVDPTYKRNGTITYLRLFRGNPGNYRGAGNDAPSVKATLYGCWPSSLKLPDMDINGDEGDGDCMLEVTLNFDDVEVQDENILGF